MMNNNINEEIVNERSAEMLTLTTLLVITFGIVAAATYTLIECFNDFSY